MANQSNQLNKSIPAGGNSATVIIFGATGDLTARKLMPALYALWKNSYLSQSSPIVGIGRRDKTDEEFRGEMFSAVSEHSRCGEVATSDWQQFSQSLFYRKLDIENTDEYTRLSSELVSLERDADATGDRVAYMATAPDLFLPAVRGMSAAGIIPGDDSKSWLRVVFEKPFGRDLDSSQELSQHLRALLREDQIYRIDHYLGKETVQNILLFRFGNSIFEPLLNRSHVDHVQITVAESQGIERGRGAYYDQSGALRDVLQNHVLQLLTLIAMEPPARFVANAIRDEKLKVLQALMPGQPGSISKWAVPGQYEQGLLDGETVSSYREEERVASDSLRETFVAMDVRVDNWRWAGVPFYLRTGKRMPQRLTEIAIQFKLPPQHLFTTVECDGDICDIIGAQPNTLVFRIQPNESIELTCSTKRPGMQYHLHPVSMDFTYQESFDAALPEAYERLLLDVMRGDSTLFTRSDELEAAWSFVSPILDSWEEGRAQPEMYRAGTWGPAAADELIKRSGNRWRVPI